MRPECQPPGRGMQAGPGRNLVTVGKYWCKQGSSLGWGEGDNLAWVTTHSCIRQLANWTEQREKVNTGKVITDNNVQENFLDWNEWRMEFQLKELWNPYWKDGHYIYLHLAQCFSGLLTLSWLWLVRPCSGEIFPSWNVLVIITGATWLTRPGRHWPVMWTLTHSLRHSLTPG